METTFERQCRMYRQQQTVAGSRTQTALDEMARKLTKVTNRPVESGKLIPVIDSNTGKVTRFIER